MVQTKYNKANDKLLTQAYLFCKEFEEDFSLFSAFSYVFDNSFLESFRSKIEFAASLPPIDVYYNQKTTNSLKVSEDLSLAKAHYQKLLFYVRLAWSNSEAVLQNFGNNLYLNVGRSASKMISILELAYKNAIIPENAALLLVVGFGQTDIDEILARELALQESYISQQDFFQTTYTLTDERNTAFNAIWDDLVLISRAAKLIFSDSPAKKHFYLLYPKR